jgi:hypothetical protein
MRNTENGEGRPTGYVREKEREYEEANGGN